MVLVPPKVPIGGGNNRANSGRTSQAARHSNLQSSHSFRERASRSHPKSVKASSDTVVMEIFVIQSCRLTASKPFLDRIIKSSLFLNPSQKKNGNCIWGDEITLAYNVISNCHILGSFNEFMFSLFFSSSVLIKIEIKSHGNEIVFGFGHLHLLCCIAIRGMRQHLFRAR